MFAQTIICGRVGKDPETRFTGGGAQVTNFSVAVSRKFKNRDGEQKEETTWYSVVAWQKLAEIVQQYVHKGDLVLLVGEMQRREWEAKDGSKRESWELRASTLKMLTGKKNGSAPAAHAEAEPQISDEDIPF